MTIQIVVPALGESVVGATVGTWLKQEGDAVQAGEALVSLETDKVDLDVTATQSGVLGKITRQTGEDVQVGDLLVTIEEQGSAAAGDAATPADASAALTPAEKAGAPVGATENSGGSVIPDYGGIPPAGENAATAKAEPKADAEPAPKPDTQDATAQDADATRVTPVAKRMAAEKGVDLAEVAGAGPGGRVTKRDIESYVQERAQAKPSAPAVAPPAAPAPEKRAATVAASAPAPSSTPSSAPSSASGGAGRREERTRMSRRRRTIAERLVEAQQTAAMLTTFNEVDMSAVMDLRARRRDEFKTRQGVGLGFMSFFVKATIGALKQFPPLNGSIDGSDIVLKHYYDIGIAVGSEEGLVVPVLRDADRMSFAGIEKSINSLVEKVQGGTLALEDLRGGTFTITNGGVFGSLLSTPILNPPQVGILGMHKIEQRPVVVNGEIVARPMMYLALSYDHRMVDGREAVQFLVAIKRLIEDPEELLLAG